MRLADRKAAVCSACSAPLNDRRAIDCEAGYDGVPVYDKDTRTIAVLPWTGTIAAHDDLFICEVCVRTMMELMALKPEVQAKQFTEIRRLELQNEHWKATCRRLKDELDRQMEANLGPKENRRRRAA